MSKGRRQLLNTLYETNRQKIYYFCHAMLMSEKEAVSAAAWVFEATFQEVLDGRLGEEAFGASCRKKAANYCKKQITKDNAKAFKTPAAKNFFVKDFADTEFDTGLNQIDILLRVLPQPQNFLFVLNRIGRLGMDEIADVTGMKEDIVKLALEAEERNLSLADNFTQGKGGKALPTTKEELDRALEEACASCGVPQALDERVKKCIDDKMLPEERKAKNKTFMVSGILAVVAVIVAAVVLFGLGRRSDDAVDDEGGVEIDDAFMVSDFGDYDDSSEKQLTYADIDVKGYGVITVALDASAAPKTVDNFIELAESGFYDGLTFHRIIEGFMMQGGDPEGNGSGGSKKTIKGEFSANGVENTLSHTRGAISMARANDYDSASSQFFIVQQDSTYLDGQYAAFGYVTEGMDVVDQVCKDAKPTDNNGTIPAAKQPVITSVVIHRE